MSIIYNLAAILVFVLLLVWLILHKRKELKRKKQACKNCTFRKTDCGACSDNLSTIEYEE